MIGPLSDATLAARRALIALGRRYFGLGWLFATVGNLSARVGDRVVITASGRHKGDLVDADFVEVDLAGRLVGAGFEGGRASAEAAIHLAVYRAHPDAGFCLHVHTVASTLVAGGRRDLGELRAGVPVVVLSGLEMLKAWDLWDEDVVAALPVFDNHADVARIAAEVAAYFAHRPRPPVPALIVRGHGITAWGPDAFSANRHLEATEFLCQVVGAR
ncbi:MAG: methylthioribulose 1-phosphate dehydratase [Deltaproteobacteria bacterium]|nr:methylthioribulose 1-phosphate dehydratase [Deltaproteobacteria bacterium]